MEVSGSVLRRSSVCPSVPRVRVSARSEGVRVLARGGLGFSDEGHLRYYLPPLRLKCGGGKEAKEKKRSRMLKGLSKDLSAFHSMGFGIGKDHGMAGEVKERTVSEAAELLLAQLKQLRAEEKEQKRIRKQEKAAMKAAKRKDKPKDDTSSSSSSDSSDSECNAVVRIDSLKAKSIVEQKPAITSLSLALSPSSLEPKSEDRIDSKPGFGISSSCCSPEISGSDRIEVCMGGKCKKSGALELMAEFERKVGAEGAVVVGCKCMGKCRDGPNVRVLNRGTDEEEKRSLTTNPLFIGVGLDDVGSIVGGLFGKQRSDLGLMTT